MMGRCQKILFLSVFFIICTSKSFIYEVSVLKKWNSDIGKYQYFIGLSDFHEKKNKINFSQLRDFEEILGNCSSSLLKIGSENIGSPSQGRSAKCERFFVRSRGGVLSGFGKKCKNFNLDVFNLEYRYCRVAALGPVLNNLNLDIKKLPSVNSIKVLSIIREIEDMFKEIFLYRDGPLLTEFYNTCINRVKQRIYNLKLYSYVNLTVADYLEIMSTKKNRAEFLKNILTFDSILIDLRLLHNVINMQNKESYLAVAGGSHIKRVSRLIEKLGWSWVHSTIPKFVKERNMRNCLGGNIIEGESCKKPKAIDFRFVKDYL